MPKWLKKLIEFLQKIIFVPTTPAPTPTPTPEPVPTILDNIDPKTIKWGEKVDPTDWKITAKIVAGEFTSDGVRATYTGTENWPVRPDGGEKPTIGNWWVVAKIDGVWHGSTIEWLGKGATRVVHKKWDGTDDFHGPLANWRPKSGEVIGIMISTVGRAAPYTIQERSQIYTTVI